MPDDFEEDCDDYYGGEWSSDYEDFHTDLGVGPADYDGPFDD